MTDNSEPIELEKGKDAPESSDRKDSGESPKQSLGDYVERILTDVLGTLARFISTIYLFTFRPHRAADQLSKDPPDYTVLVRPRTFLLLGCLFYSVLLSVFELSIDPPDANTRALSHRDTTESVIAGLQQLLSDGVSLLTLVITTLPILIVTSLSAVLAGHVFKYAKNKATTFFIYLYGQQGFLLLLYMLSVETQMGLFRGTEYRILIIFTLILGLAIQAIRCFRSILSNGNPFGKVTRVLCYLAFVGFFIIPIPLSGFTVIAMHESALQVKEENRRSPGPAIRIIDVTTPTFDGTKMSIELTALVENRSTQTLVMRPGDVEFEVYFVSHAELNPVVNYGLGPSNVDAHLNRYNRYSISLNEARIETSQEGQGIWTLAPTSDGLIRVLASQEVMQIKFIGGNRDWEREKLMVMELEQVPELQRLAFVTDGRKMIVQLKLTDYTSDTDLVSGFYRARSIIPAPSQISE